MYELTHSTQNEFWFHVANQDEIPILGNVDNTLDIPLLISILRGLPETNEQKEQEQYISEIVKQNPDTVDLLRTFVGVSDKRMYLELSYMFAKTKYQETDEKNIIGTPLYELPKHNIEYFKTQLRVEAFETSAPELYTRGAQQGQPKPQELRRQEKIKFKNKAREIIVAYLVNKGLLNVLSQLKGIERAEWDVIVKNLIDPKENQQKETKLRGHSAEQKLAELLHQIEVTYIPANKHLNPMGAHDPNVDKNSFELRERDENTTWSFDIIIKKNEHEFIAFLQSLIHTSDPGQYGVNKSGETVQIKRNLSEHNGRNNGLKELWGLVDGVGFIENPKKTIDKMLLEFDCFIQLKSLYKAALQAHKLGLITLKAICFDTTFYTRWEALAMYKKYGSKNIQCFINMGKPKKWKEIMAGKAWLYL